MDVKVCNLSKRIGRTWVLRNVSITVSGGQICGLVGPNGCGKTMLMRAIAGLIRPTDGTVMVGDKQLWKDCEFPPKLGLLLETPAFLDSRTGFENLRILASIDDGDAGVDKISNIGDSLQRVGLDPADTRKYRKYSLGMKQRLGIAAATMQSRELILLDEPTNALDVDGVAMVKKILEEERRRGAAILIASHDRDLIEDFADSVYAIYDGSVVSHSKESELERHA